MYQWMKDLFPICRSITGNGVRETLQYIKNLIPDLTIYEIPSGTKAFDWTVPDEWNISDAFVIDENGRKIIDFKNHNLCVVGYSEPVDTIMKFAQLDQHLHSLPDQPNAIPYVTSYYKRYWGFCVTEKQRQVLRQYPNKKFHVKIDATLKSGHLSYGELIIPGKIDKEILLSSYICHPSMANNELSGPVVTTALAQWVLKNNDRRFTYRIVFVPETIGAVVYLSRYWEEMKKKTIAGFVLNCLGDEGDYSYIASRLENTLSDRILLHTLKFKTDKFKTYSFLERGSDERQYCSPGIDLPICTLCRSKPGEFKEYHTSLDDLEFVSPKGLYDSYRVVRECLKLMEENCNYRIKVLCEPQLGKRDLYPNLSIKEGGGQNIKNMMNFIAYADGNHDLIEIAEKINVYAGELLPIAARLLQVDLLEKS